PFVKLLFFSFGSLGNWCLVFVCDLVLVIWNLFFLAPYAVRRHVIDSTGGFCYIPFSIGHAGGKQTGGS
ncbi:MAG: hypothetical protein JXO51_02345, partial [Candidatus Aminicenantes bacterium]|nr:hypothetical protein [Candidatus Aminicenantes bacterium]